MVVEYIRNAHFFPRLSFEGHELCLQDNRLHFLIHWCHTPNFHQELPLQEMYSCHYYLLHTTL